MSKLADILQRHRAALKAEATALAATADKETDGKLTAEQEIRFKAIEAEITEIDAQIAATQPAPAETPEQIATRVRNEVAEVTATCALAGQPERASEFIKSGASLSEVVKTLQASRVRDGDLNPRGGARQPGRGDASAQEVAAGWEASAAKTNKMLGLAVAR